MSKTISEALKKRVKAGAAFLDVVKPNWWKKGEVDLEELDLAQPNVCMLGELYGDYNYGKTKLGLDNESAEFVGFYSSINSRYAAITKLWKAKIRALRKKA